MLQDAIKEIVNLRKQFIGIWSIEILDEDRIILNHITKDFDNNKKQFMSLDNLLEWCENNLDYSKD